MPELIEVEVYRRLADQAVGRTVTEVEAPDLWYLKGGVGPDEVRGAVVGAQITGTDRQGKLLALHLAGRPDLGLHFGMTGRLVLGEDAPIDRLVYGASADDPKWDRFALHLDDGRRLRMNDPRRLGGVELDPDRTALGPDAWTITAEALGAALAGSSAPLKARLLDQARVAGLGNLLTDESLWRARLDPQRRAGSLDEAEVARLADQIHRTVTLLFERGGSHRGGLQEQRRRGGVCPRCGAELHRRTIGGRTTYSCPIDQPAA